jgi:hypothetical protein
MANQTTVLYAHRRKEDGSYDSMCLACLTTISSRESEAALSREEEDHVCKYAFPQRRTRVRTPGSGTFGRRQSDMEWERLLAR